MERPKGSKGFHVTTSLFLSSKILHFRTTSSLSSLPSRARIVEADVRLSIILYDLFNQGAFTLL